MGVHSDVEQVTPEMAHTWLAKNEVNRNLRSRLVRQYADDMMAGRWRLTGENIILSSTGRLIDGQHRLHAVIRSGKTIPMLVTHGIADKAQELIDQGAVRTVADAIRMNGGANTTAAGALTRMLAINPEPGPAMTHFNAVGRAPSRGQQLAIYHARDESIQAAVSKFASAEIRRQLPGPPSAWAYCYYHFRALDADDADRFIDAIIQSLFDGPEDPRRAAYLRLRSYNLPHGAQGQMVVVSVLTRAWNMWRKGTPARSIMAVSRGVEVKPQRPA